MIAENMSTKCLENTTVHECNEAHNDAEGQPACLSSNSNERHTLAMRSMADG